MYVAMITFMHCYIVRQNGTETEWKYISGVEVIEQQTADFAFRFDEMEQNGNVTVFMPPTVCNSILKMPHVCCLWSIIMHVCACILHYPNGNSSERWREMVATAEDYAMISTKAKHTCVEWAERLKCQVGNL